MTISLESNNYNIVTGNVSSIDKADVILLLEDHNTREDFEKIERIIDTYYNPSSDLILLEHPQNSSTDHLLCQEEKLGSWRVKVLKDKNLAGWDHPHHEKKVKEFYQSPDVKAFLQAIITLETLGESTTTEEVSQSFKTLVRGVRHLKSNPDLLPPEDYEDLIKNKKFHSAEFIDLKDTLLKTGRKVLLLLEEVFIERTFPSRQDALVKSLEENTLKTISNKGKVFVVMGEHHGNPFKSPYSKEVQKVIDFLAKNHNFLSI